MKFRQKEKNPESSKQELPAAFKVDRSDAANQSFRLKYQFDACSSSKRGKNSGRTLFNVNVPTLWKTETLLLICKENVTYDLS